MNKRKRSTFRRQNVRRNAQSRAWVGAMLNRCGCKACRSL